VAYLFMKYFHVKYISTGISQNLEKFLESIFSPTNEIVGTSTGTQVYV